LEAGFAEKGAIACTQPRRVAATSLAERVAAEQNTQLGTRVGYSVRFDEKCSRGTKIKYLTDGMLVRELLGDPLLSKYNVIIVDEAHERTLRTDFLLASLKNIQKKRNAKSEKQPAHKSHPLKIVIMSATLDAERFSQYYDKFVSSFPMSELDTDAIDNQVRRSSISRDDSTLLRSCTPRSHKRIPAKQL
jgi:ATP-dependent RNA helicase DHX33